MVGDVYVALAGSPPANGTSGRMGHQARQNSDQEVRPPALAYSTLRMCAITCALAMCGMRSASAAIVVTVQSTVGRI
jgi:hypothetical protein